MSAQLSLRYLILQVEWGASLPSASSSSSSSSDALDPSSATPTDLFSALRGLYQELFGDAGWGCVSSSLAVTYYSAATRLAVVRCPAAAEEGVRACAALLRAVRRRAVALHALQCVSTVRGLREALQRLTAGVAGALRLAQGASAVLDDAFFEALQQEALGVL